MTGTATGGGAPRGGLWRHSDFRKLWTAETISQFGTQVSLLAIPYVAITILRASPFEVALLGTIEFLPFVLFSLPAGVWVDRLRRRPILIVGDLGRALSLASVPVAYLLGVLAMPQLYVVGFINGVLTVFFDVAYQSYLPALVERDQLVEGNSKLEVSRSAAQIAGPGFAGALIGLATAPLAVIVDAVSFVGSALFVFGIRRREPPPEPAATRPDDRRGSGMRREIGEGLGYVLGHRYLRAIAACTGSANLFSNIAFSIYLVYAVRELGLSAEVIGIVFALGNVSVLVAALVASRIAAVLGLGRTIVASAFLFAPGVLLVALAPRQAPVPFLIAAGSIGGFASVVYNINQVSFRQAVTPERMQGRMNATMRFIVWGTIPLGLIIGGVLGNTIGLLPTIWIGALGSFLPVLPVLLSPVRSLRAMPPPLEETAETPEAAPEAAEARLDLAGDGGRAVVGGPGPVPRADES